MYIKFLNSDAIYSGKIKKVKPHVISVKCEAVNVSGFNLYLDADGKRDIGGSAYNDFVTLYKNDGKDLYGKAFDGYFLSDDGSQYMPRNYITEDKEGGK